MRLNTKLIFAFSLLTGFLFFGDVSYGQDSKRLDSLIKVTTLEMYVNPDKVIAVGKKIVEESGDDVDYKIKAYRLISDGYSSKRDYKKSLEYVIKATNLLPQSKNGLLKISLITKAGIQYHQLKIYDKAIQYLDQAEKLCLEYPIRDSVHVSLGTNYLVRGFIYKEKLNCDIAISFLDRGINEILKDNNLFANANRLSIAKYNKGNCYMLMSDNESATKSFLEAIGFAKQINAYSLQAFAQKGLAQVYTLEGKYNEAIELLQDAHRISSNVNDLVLDQEIYKGLSENYLAVSQWDNYQKYRLKYLTTQTKLKERERESISDSLKEIEKEENKKFEVFSSNFFIGILVTSLILVFVIVFFVLYVRKSKKTIENLHQVVKNLQNEKPLSDSK